MGNLSYLDEKEVEAEYPPLNRKKLQTWRYLKSGGPPFVRVGARIFYIREDIEQFLESCKVTQ